MAQIPPLYFNCVVALGRIGSGEQATWIASGFLYGYFVERLGEQQVRFRGYLVSNRHVFENEDTLVVSFNPRAAGAAQKVRISMRDQERKPRWFAHPNPEIDVAVLPVAFKFLEDQGLLFDFFRSHEHVAGRDRMSESGVSEGDDVYVLGFPLGLVGEPRNMVVARRGSIARIRDCLEKATPSFLIDAFVFPGNSGGPVIVRPGVTAVSGTRAVGKAYLIGVVSGYVPYRDEAVSRQTGRLRVTFEENSGLAVVFAADFIDDAIREHLRTIPEAAEAATSVAPAAAPTEEAGEVAGDR